MRYGWLLLALSLAACGGGFNRKNKEGAELYREGKLDEALTAFTQAQVESPDAAELHYNIGNVHYRKEEMDKRFDQAKYLLSSTKSSIASVGYDLGFNDQAHFTRAFKKQFGLTPGQFQKQVHDQS